MIRYFATLIVALTLSLEALLFVRTSKIFLPVMVIVTVTALIPLLQHLLYVIPYIGVGNENRAVRNSLGVEWRCI